MLEASFVASSMDTSSFWSSDVLSESSRIVDLPSSIAAVNASISSVSLLRVILLFPISASQNPSCSASCLASSIRRVIMLSIIFFTFENGSAAIFSANRARVLLLSRLLSEETKSRTRRRMPIARSIAARLAVPCKREVAEMAWAKERCFSALPDTLSEERIWRAFAIASISSVLKSCFSWKDNFFCSHSEETSDKVSSSAALEAVVDCNCLSASAFLPNFCSFTFVFSSTSFSAFSIVSAKPCTIMLAACAAFISSF
mmetsp:Transcript_61372/g.155883  ORF Transcript_61372/g.155883 Transcript_61372/m.155883 type:complete len:258 (-) Transcript_61372:646-1419(-)